MKKTHLVNQPTRVIDMNFEEFDDAMDTRWSERAERARVRSYRKLRRQEA